MNRSPMKTLCFAWLACCLLFTGCQSTPTEVGTTRVPVLKGAKLKKRDRMGASVGSSFNNLKSVTTTTWYFDVEASLQEIETFYRTQFPEAEFEFVKAEMTVEEAIASGDYEEGEIVEEDFMDYIEVFIPQENPEIDELTLIIRKGEFSISETVND